MMRKAVAVLLIVIALGLLVAGVTDRLHRRNLDLRRAVDSMMGPIDMDLNGSE